ncbi:hypothetical protein M408DRAFT_7560 [Serendipita vermifera MAFF 305830]|uniref:Uncharacterized protein n=1 Tax=Serendipita vermifera MAFF 305830 TaxID=933852 RepID=A0A0C3BG75_SERVB|nr:hypothetical protein M408DRAFT_7560 [Serendipita vermifera MAFF 305830]
MQDDIDYDEEAAKKAFSYVKEENIIRMLNYFKTRRLNKKYVPQLAELFGVHQAVVIEFGKWCARQELDSNNNTPSSSVPPNQAFHSPVRESPQAHGPAENSIVKMEVDDAAATLPTPQGSVEPTLEISPSPPRGASPGHGAHQLSFYDTWLQARTASPTTVSPVSSGHPSSILQLHLPPSLAHFAFGSANAT